MSETMRSLDVVHPPVPVIEEKEIIKADDLEAYAAWRREAPDQFRRLVEAKLLGVKPPPDRSATPLVAEFLSVCDTLLHAPETDASSIAADARVLRQAQKLQALQLGDGKLANVFAVLADLKVSWSTKLAYYKKVVRARLDLFASLDRKALEKYKAQTPDEEIGLKIEESEDSYTVRRAPEGETKEGEPREATALVFPYFGGYYTGSVMDRYDPETFTWSTSPRHSRVLPLQIIDEERKRVYRAVVRHGERVPLHLPDGWGVKQSKDQPLNFFVDQAGTASFVLTAAVEGVQPITIEIGPSRDAVLPEPPTGSVATVLERFPSEFLEQAKKICAEQIPAGIKLRRVTSFIRNHLEYNKDASWEMEYKADPASYYEKIWENKQAKCDEANTLAARLLQKLGWHVRFLGKHSVREKSKRGEAVLGSSNLHGWFRAWDPEAKQWLRLDATPKGDPNVDEAEQSADLGEGDYGEQEVELMSEDELQKRLLENQKQKEEAEAPEVRFAKEAHCALAEAKAVLEKIDHLRRDHARVLADATAYWKKIVRKNFKEHIKYRGPVPMSLGHELEDVVEASTDIRAHEIDPGGWVIEETAKREQKLFGGYEVCLGVDLSGSMNDTIAGVKKADSQRDMAFLFIESIMTNAVVARKSADLLRQPMPVRVSLTVFGQVTEVVLPLTDRWGPTEQIRVYRALAAGAGGGTPDHLALGMIEEQIRLSQAEEETKRKKTGKISDQGQVHRFVVIIADGGSSDSVSVKLINDRLSSSGIPVDLFLIADEADVNLKKAAEAAYQSVSIVSQPKQLADNCLARLTTRLQEVYGK